MGTSNEPEEAPPIGRPGLDDVRAIPRGLFDRTVERRFPSLRQECITDAKLRYIAGTLTAERLYFVPDVPTQEYLRVGPGDASDGLSVIVTGAFVPLPSPTEES
jgi:hypothetical protein